MAKDDYQAGLLGETMGHDTFSLSYQWGAQDREKRMTGGDGASGAGGAGGGGAVFAALMVIVAFCAFVLSFCSYPIAGAATLAAFVFGVVTAGEGMNGVGLVFAFMVPCYIVYYLCWPLEKKTAAGSLKYRVFRQYWRIVVGTYAFHTLGTAFHLSRNYPEGAPLSGYMIDAALTVAGFFLVYLNSHRLDKKYGLEPVYFDRLDKIAAPVLNRLVPPVPRDLRDTGALQARDMEGKALTAGVNAGAVTAGEISIPLAKIRDVTIMRGHRGKLITGGVVLFFMGPVMVKGLFGNFYDFLPQLFGLAGIIASVVMVLLGLLPRLPAGKLGGPFRSIEIYYEGADGQGAFRELRFATATDERRFTTALYNGMKALKKSAPDAAAISSQQPQAA